MVGSNRNQTIHEICCDITALDRHKPYGGLSTLYTGDMKQLEPVKDSFIFKPPTIHNRSRAAENLWNLFVNYHLTEKIRSAEDEEFSSLCDRVGMNECTKEDFKFLQSRDIPCPLVEDPENFKHGKVFKSLNSFNIIYNFRYK